MRCINLYKNLLRDFRMYFNEKYAEFQNLNQLNKANILINSVYFPLIFREYMNRTFDPQILSIIL